MVTHSYRGYKIEIYVSLEMAEIFVDLDALESVND